MNEDKLHDYALLWPDLLSVSKLESIYIGDGWVSILDTVFHIISEDVEKLRRHIKYSDDNPGAKFLCGTREEMILLLEDSIKKLPIITEVYESSSGALQINVETTCPEYQPLFEFARIMSSKVCFDCGIPVDPSSNRRDPATLLCKECSLNYIDSDDTV